jgi:hypothetical protein
MKTAYPLTPPPAGQTGATGSDRVGQGEQVVAPLACLLQFTIRLPYLERSRYPGEHLERSESPASTPLESVPRYRAAGTPGAGTPGEVYPVLPYPIPDSSSSAQSITATTTSSSPALMRRLFLLFISSICQFIAPFFRCSNLSSSDRDVTLT